MPQAIGFAFAWLASNGAALLGASVAAQATIAAAAASIGPLVVGLGVSLVYQALRGAQAPVKPSDGQIDLKSPLAPRQKSYGIVRISGPYFFLDSDENDLYMGILFNDGKINRVTSWHVDANTVELNGSNVITTNPYDETSNTILHHLGEDTETPYTSLANIFGLTEMRGDGIFSALAKFRNSASDVQITQKMFPEGRPLLRATCEASLVWDPRDPAQSRLDRSTWAWTENLAVCWLNFLMDTNGFAIPYARIEPNLQEWRDAADICDEQVDLKGGGTVSRYVVSGTWRYDVDPKIIEKNFEAACDGRMWTKRDGSIGVSVGRYVTPTVTIRAQDILAYDLDLGTDRLVAPAGIRAQYVSPAHDFREHEAEPWPTGAAVVGLTDERVGNLELFWVPNHSQTRRLQKRAYIKQNSPLQGTITTNLAGMLAMDQRYVFVEIEGELSGDSALVSCEVGKFSLDLSSLTCTMEIVEVGPEIDDWDADAEEGDEEGGTFAYAEKVQLLGTALDPLTDLDGQVGDTVVVHAIYIGATPPSAPTGWGTIGTPATGSGYAQGAFWKKLDGTETAGTFLAGAGVLSAFRFRFANAPAFADVEQHTDTSLIGSQRVSSGTKPFVTFVFAAIGAVQTTAVATLTTQPSGSPPSEAIVPDEQIIGGDGATVTVEADMFFFGPTRASRNVDVVVPGDGAGSNVALLAFRLDPGG